MKAYGTFPYSGITSPSSKATMLAHGQVHGRFHSLTVPFFRRPNRTGVESGL